ncbi:hypothetical protein [Eggerthella sinensis]|nr:hypothetical protein [Eggerthella sinensis]
MRISNLKKGVVGVCAATMLAGMCAVPAFAEDTTFNDGTMTSTVTANTTALGQINVTVPTPDLSGVAATDGTLVFGDYKFTNHSTLGIKVAKMTVTKDASANLVKADAVTGDNAINVKATIGTTVADLVDYMGADQAVADAPTIAKDAVSTITFTGSIANATKDGINASLPVASIVWTLETV